MMRLDTVAPLTHVWLEVFYLFTQHTPPEVVLERRVRRISCQVLFGRLVVWLLAFFFRDVSSSLGVCCGLWDLAHHVTVDEQGASCMRLERCHVVSAG